MLGCLSMAFTKSTKSIAAMRALAAAVPSTSRAHAVCDDSQQYTPYPLPPTSAVLYFLLKRTGSIFSHLSATNPAVYMETVAALGTLFSATDSIAVLQILDQVGGTLDCTAVGLLAVPWPGDAGASAGTAQAGRGNCDQHKCSGVFFFRFTSFKYSANTTRVVFALQFCWVAARDAHVMVCSAIEAGRGAAPPVAG